MGGLMSLMKSCKNAWQSKKKRHQGGKSGSEPGDSPFGANGFNPFWP